MDDVDMEYWTELDTHPLQMSANEQFLFWSKLPETDVNNFAAALERWQPENSFVSSWTTPYRGWNFDLKKGTDFDWLANSIFSIKYGEAVANRAGPVHILYQASTDANLPPSSLMTLAELPLVTGPGSRVTQIYRWDLDTYQTAMSGSGGPQYNVIWQAGDAQLGTEITDLTTNPAAVEGNTLVF